MIQFKKSEKIDGKYELKELVAETNTCEVWQCINGQKEDYAIKLYTDSTDKSALDSPLLGKLKKVYSKNILHPKDTGRTDEGLFFNVMGFYPINMLDMIRKRAVEKAKDSSYKMLDQPLYNDREAVGIINQLADGLKALHAYKLAHLDIKPSNIMVDESGGKQRFLYSDFDNMRDLDKTIRKGRLKEDHGISPYYAAPEQFNKDYYAELCSDIYSLGVTCFEVLAGDKIPYGGTKEIADFEKRQAEVVQKLSAMRFDPHIIGIVESCLAVNKQARPEAKEIHSVTQFFLDTGRWPNARPQPAPVLPPRIPSPPLPPTPKNRGNLRVVFGALAVAFLGVVTYFFWPFDSEGSSIDSSSSGIVVADERCSTYAKTFKRNWSANIDIVALEGSEPQLYGLQNGDVIFDCGYLRITNLEKGYALVFIDNMDNAGIISEQGEIVRPVGEVGLEELKEHYKKGTLNELIN